MPGRLKWLDWELRLKAGGIVLAAGYAALYVLLRLVSVDQWYLPAGLRVGALLLFPCRYWPYLIAGEFCAFAYLRYPMLEKHGLVWAVVASAVLMPAVAAIVHAHRRLLSPERLYWFLCVAALSALAVSALNLAGMAFLMHPQGEPVSLTVGLRQVIGQYLGILTIAPLALLWRRGEPAYAFPRRLRWDVVAACGAIAALCACTALLHTAEGKNLFRVLMIVPAVALTFLHGWRGAVIGLLGVNVGLRLTMQLENVVLAHDLDALAAQEILAVAGTALLWLGAAISHYYQKARQHGLAERQALDMARLSFLSSERELRERVAQIQAVGQQIDTSYHDLARWLRERGHHAAAMDVLRSGVLQSRMLKEQLNLVFPPELERYGLYGALDSETVDHAWGQRADLVRQFHGDPRQLSPGLQLAAYRSIGDAVGLLSDGGHAKILLRVRCGRSHGRRGIAVRVAPLDRGSGASSPAADFALGALEARVRAHGGLLHRHGSSIDLLMDEPCMPAGYCAPAFGLPTAHTTLPASA